MSGGSAVNGLIMAAIELAVVGLGRLDRGRRERAMRVFARLLHDGWHEADKRELAALIEEGVLCGRTAQDDD